MTESYFDLACSPVSVHPVLDIAYVKYPLSIAMIEFIFSQFLCANETSGNFF
jgi:hypothetical protein